MSKGLFLSIFLSFVAHALVIAVDASSATPSFLPFSLKTSEQAGGERLVVGLKSAAIKKTKTPPSPSSPTSKNQQASPEEQSGGESSAPAVTLDRPSLIGDDQPEYPALARRKQQVGDVYLVYRIAADGTVASPRIERSSGHPLLDQSALDFIRTRRYHLPPHWNSAATNEQKLTISYRLE